MSKRNSDFWKIVLVVLIIALIIISMGWFAEQKKKEDEAEEQRKKEEERARELARLTARLKEVEDRIAKLTVKRDHLIRLERSVFIWSRVVVALVLVVVNFWYASSNGYELGKQVNFTEAILIGYSFLVFITYGTPSRFVEELKGRTRNVLWKRHVSDLLELEELEKESLQLKNDIAKLNNLSD